MKLNLIGTDGQSPEDKELAHHVRSKVEEIRSSANRIAHEGIWITNIAYLLGYDGIYYNTSSRSFQAIDRASSGLKRNRIHVNKILPTVQNRLARLCKSPPKYDVRPESSSNDDKEAGRLSLQILTSLWDKLSINEKRLSLYMWTQQCGHAYIKVGWDPSDGRPMPEPLMGLSDDDEPNMGYEGEVRVEICSAFEIFPNPLAKTFEEVRRSWLIQAKVRPLDYFKTHYPNGNLVKQEDAWLLSAMYEQRINSLNARGPSQGGTQEALKNSAIELIKYEARSEKYPQGRMIVTANGILLEDKPLPVGEIPFAKFDDVTVGGKYYSESIITHLRPIQDQYNELIRRRAAWIKKFVAGKYKAPRGCGLAEEALHDGESEVVFYDPVPNAPNGPEALLVPPLPQWAFVEEDRYTMMFNDISGISEVSRGSMPSASIPAIGMQLLTEQDDSRIGVVTTQHEHAWSHVGGLVLKYVAKNYKIPRKLKIAGPSLSYTVKDVTGDMIRDNTDVYVIPGSTLPGNKFLKKQEILNAYAQGLLGDPKDPKTKEKVLGLVEFGDSGDIWQDYGLDMAQIKRGIDKMEQGESVEVSEFDNHPLWMQELNRYRKGDKFIALPPNIQAIFMQNMEQHIRGLMQIAGAPVSGPGPGPEPVSSFMPPPGAGSNPGGPPEGAPPLQGAM